MVEITALMESNAGAKQTDTGVSLKHIYLVLSVVFYASNLSAADWSLKPNLEIVESYDDNVKLNKAGEEQSDYVTELNPGLDITGTGRRAQFRLNYKLQNVFYQYNDGKDAKHHHLSAFTNAELYKNHLYLDANATYTQRNLDNLQISGNDNTSISDNRTDVIQYSVRPYYIYNFGNDVSFILEHVYAELDNKSDELKEDDTIKNTSKATLTSGKAFSKLQWTIQYQEQKTKYIEKPDIKYSDSNVSLNYLLGEKVYLLGAFGYEKYNYLPREGQGKPEGEYWEGGMGWTPSKRTRIEAVAGERYRGNTRRFSLSHQSRQTAWDITYSEVISTTSRLVTEDEIRLLKALEGDEFNPDTFGGPYNEASVALNEIYEASVKKSFSKSTLSINYSDVSTEYLESGRKQDSSTVTAKWVWEMGTKSSLSLSTERTKISYPTLDSETQHKRHEIRMLNNLGRSVTSYLAYIFSEQSSELSGGSYERNIYKAGINLRF